MDFSATFSSLRLDFVTFWAKALASLVVGAARRNSRLGLHKTQLGGTMLGDCSMAIKRLELLTRDLD
jgi:hypothetical protein